jgi:hypothetical protein
VTTAIGSTVLNLWHLHFEGDWIMAVQTNAARLHKDIYVEQDRQLRLQAIQEPQRFIHLAQQQGYKINSNNLTAEISGLSDSTIAAIWNPGIGDRRHLVRR